MNVCMPSLTPEQQHIAEVVHQVEADIVRGEVVLEGTGAMRNGAEESPASSADYAVASG